MYFDTSLKSSDLSSLGRLVRFGNIFFSSEQIFEKRNVKERRWKRVTEFLQHRRPRVQTLWKELKTLPSLYVRVTSYPDPWISFWFKKNSFCLGGGVSIKGVKEGRKGTKLFFFNFFSPHAWYVRWIDRTTARAVNLRSRHWPFFFLAANRARKRNRKKIETVFLVCRIRDVCSFVLWVNFPLSSYLSLSWCRMFADIRKVQGLKVSFTSLVSGPDDFPPGAGPYGDAVGTVRANKTNPAWPDTPAHS